MSDNPSAKERKRKRAAKVSHRASPVKVSFLPVTRRVKRQKEASAVAHALSPEPESEITKQSRFVDMRPKDIHPWDWHTLYMDDEELWPLIAEEALAAVEMGELKKYDRLR